MLPRRWACRPRAALLPLIDRFWGWETAQPHALPWLLPGTGSECLFHLGMPLKDSDGRCLPQGHLICPREQIRPLAPAQPLNFIAVRFRAGQLRHFTALPFQAVADQLLDCRQLWPDAADTLLAALQCQRDPQLRLVWLEQFLWRQLQRHHRPTEQAQDRLIERLYYAPNSRIATIAEEWGWSRRHLERRFLHAFGQTPKHFARLARLHQTLRQWTLEPERSGLAVALDRGYSDQAHFIHDVRALTGKTPGQWRDPLLQGEHYYFPPTRLPE